MFSPVIAEQPQRLVSFLLPRVSAHTDHGMADILKRQSPQCLEPFVDRPFSALNIQEELPQFDRWLAAELKKQRETTT